jgi:hypothetical protein
MKNTLLLFGMAGIAAASFSFTFIQKSDEAQNPKKERHIKMTKIENGKKMELDTVVNGDDVFVWNGDTINPGKHIKDPSPSGFDQMQQVDVNVDHRGRKDRILIINHSAGKSGEPMIWNMDSGEDMEIVTEDVDSLGKRIVVRKNLADGNEKHMIYGSCPHAVPFPPIPRHSSQVIDLNDPNVISYKKKDLSGGREKIEIVRKKSTEPEEMNFNFQTGDELMPPPPPPPPAAPGAPEIIREYNDGNENIRIIEKSTKVDGKDGKQIQVEVESKEIK